MMNTKRGSIFDKHQFEIDIQNIIRNYQLDGFLKCSVNELKQSYTTDSSQIEISFSINESKRTVIGVILFEGNKEIKTTKLLKSIYTKPGNVLNSVTLTQDITQILNLYESLGFPFASASVKDISTYTDGSTEKLMITLTIKENDKVKIDKIVIEGNTDTKSEVILREIRLPKNNSITKETILEIKQRLDNIGYFENVELPKIVKYRNSTILQIKVKEGSTNTFDGILGYVPPLQNEDKGYFTGLVNLSLKNLFGTGRKIDARWQKQDKSSQELELKYLEPWFLNQPVNVNLSFLQRVQDSTYVRRNFGIKTDALISPRFSVSLLGNVDRVIPSSSVSVSGITLFDSRLLNAGTELRYDSRDYIFNPFSGILWKTGYTVGQKKVYNFASFKDVPQTFTVQRYLIDFDFYSSFFKRQSSLVSLHGAEVRSPKLENADYFRFGGTKTVRGYREEQFLASSIIWGNFELRYSLSRKTFASVFYDIGYYRKPFEDVTLQPEQKALIYGYGVGIRIETPLGIFGVSYALGKGDTPLEGKVHFGLINDF